MTRKAVRLERRPRLDPTDSKTLSTLGSPIAGIFLAAPVPSARAMLASAASKSPFGCDAATLAMTRQAFDTLPGFIRRLGDVGEHRRLRTQDRLRPQADARANSSNNAARRSSSIRYPMLSHRMSATGIIEHARRL